MNCPLVYILKHVPNEDAGTIKDYLKVQAIPFETVDLFDGQALPQDLSRVRAAVILGGPMNVYQEKEFPFLKEENIFIQQLMDKNIPILGVCLGAQLIAKATGAKVMKAAAEEIGWDTLQLTSEAAQDPLFSTIGAKTLKVLQWHGDTFELPKNAVHLAKSAMVPHQAYRLRNNIYGFQFHIEVNRAMVEDWFKSHTDLKQFLKEYDQYESKLKSITERFYEIFFKSASL